MFDLFNGLPVHILVLHAFVVLGPIAALTAIAYVARPAWRRALQWPTVVLAAIAGISGLVTKESGEKLEHRLMATADAAGQAAIHQHAEAGDLAGMLALAFLIVTIVAVLWFLPALKQPRFGMALQMIAAVSVVLVALGMLGSIVYAGHLGASAAWRDQITTGK